MSQRDDRREPREITVDGGVNATVSSRSRTSERSALFDGALAGVADPYPAYARLRAEDPIHRTPHGLWVLTRHADVAAVLRDPRFGRERFAIEETLRWESPVQRTWRIAKADVELAGQRIPAGALVVLLLGAANRDPARFPEPDRFDLDRRAAGHLALSAGLHVCLGAARARLEAQIAIATLLRRWPSLRLTSERPAWRPTATLRGLATLPVEW